MLNSSLKDRVVVHRGTKNLLAGYVGVISSVDVEQNTFTVNWMIDSKLNTILVRKESTYKEYAISHVGDSNIDKINPTRSANGFIALIPEEHGTPMSIRRDSAFKSIHSNIVSGKVKTPTKHNKCIESLPDPLMGKVVINTSSLSRFYKFFGIINSVSNDEVKVVYTHDRNGNVLTKTTARRYTKSVVSKLHRPKQVGFDKGSKITVFNTSDVHDLDIFKEAHTVLEDKNIKQNFGIFINTNLTDTLDNVTTDEAVAKASELALTYNAEVQLVVMKTVATIKLTTTVIAE